MANSCYSLFEFYWLDRLMQLVSLWGNGVFIPLAIVLIVSAALFYDGKRKEAFILVFAALVGELTKDLLKIIAKAPRPRVFECRDISGATGFSFPSGHTVFYTIFFGFIFYLAKKYYWHRWWGRLAGIFSLIMVLLIGFSRVYLGAHWLIDVLIGYALGGLILWGAIKACND